MHKGALSWKQCNGLGEIHNGSPGPEKGKGTCATEATSDLGEIEYNP